MKLNKVTLTIFSFLSLGQPGLLAQKVTDIEGNIYKAVTIGTQTWMAKNLKTVTYNDGSPILLVTNDSAWQNHDSIALVMPAYYWYDNDSTNRDIYGIIYNAFAVTTGKLCPVAWHVPSDEEWTVLTTYLGGEEIAGGKLKEKGTAHWQNPNLGASNETGFTSLPGGYRTMNGKFSYINGGSGWWSSTEYNSTRAWSRGMHSDTDHVSRGANELPNGLYVRCLKD